MTISAIIPAAGQSKRMGKPKLLLPWGETTVLGHVLQTIQAAEVTDILVITGGAREGVERVCNAHQVRTLHNPDFEYTDMLESIQFGISGQLPEVSATLICPGDHPQIETEVVQMVCASHQKQGCSLVVPSFKMRRGHPWLVARQYWAEILNLRSPQSMRDFLNNHSQEILYVEVNSPKILQDLDTPTDYLQSRP